jgi:CubicO group peptidase (beta-lactamase class C family)
VNIVKQIIAALVLNCAVTPAFAAPLPSDAEITQMLSVRVDLQRGATGVVVGIATPHGNRIVAYGTRSPTDKTQVDGDTVYDVGSITKVFTALLLSDMARQHEVSLDQPVQTLLPADRVTMPVYEGRQITLADLATHTAGLPLRPANLPSKDPVNPYAGYTGDELYAFLSFFKLKQAPGTNYEYSNVGYGLLGLALARRENTDYADLVAKRITLPLGMPDTRIDPTDDMTRREATGYDRDLKTLPHEDEGVLVAAGSLRSTTNDLLKMLDVALGFRKSPLRASLDAMTNVRRPGGMQPATSIALAWNIFDDKGREIVWKNGSVNGYRAFMGYDAKAHLGIVALANAQTGNGADDIGLHILDPGYAADLEVPTRHIEIALSEDVLDRFVGKYRFSPTDQLTVVRNGDHLQIIVAPNQPPIEIYAEGAASFFLKVVNAQVKFDDIRDGHAGKAIWHQSGQDQVGERVN